MLGLVDWGIGGIGVLREIARQCARSGRAAPAMLYLSDTGVPAYGSLDRAALTRRLRAVIGFLRARGVGPVLLACNAASTVLDGLADANVSGVILPTLDFVGTLRGFKRIAVIGGQRTIASRVYRTGLVERGFEVIAKVAQPLSALIERGDRASPAFRRAVAQVLRGTRSADALLLACTHYPAAFGVFEQLFDGRVIDPLPPIARAVLLQQRNVPAGPTQFFTTGDPRQMQHAAARAWGDSFATLDARRTVITPTG